MGGQAERFESFPGDSAKTFPNLSLNDFNLADVKAVTPSQSRVYGPLANERLEGSVDLNQIKDKNLPVYNIDSDPAMSEFKQRKTEAKIPLGDDVNVKIGGLLNFSVGKSWKF